MKMRKKGWYSFILIVVCFMQGCWVPTSSLVIAGLGGVFGAQLYNGFKDQYPHLNFESKAPIEVTYKESPDKVWDTVIEILKQRQEIIIVADKNSGEIQTQENTLNNTNWLQKGLGEATFYYEYKIFCRDSSVKANARFSSEKFLVSKKNVPEGTNVMRHILFDELNKRLTKVQEKFL